jgi:hypothetical protein
MRTFEEFVQNQANQQPAGNVFSKIGMGEQDLPRFMRGLRQMLSAKGVVNDADSKKAARQILAILKPPIMRLSKMGLEANDIMMVVQEVINLIVGLRSFTGHNPGMVRSRISSQI